MYKILKNITWCGKQFQEGDQYDFPEATRPAQLKVLVDKGLIEPIEVAKAPEAKSEQPKAESEKPKTKTETRFKKQDKK